MSAASTWIHPSLNAGSLYQNHVDRDASLQRNGDGNGNERRNANDHTYRNHRTSTSPSPSRSKRTPPPSLFFNSVGSRLTQRPSSYPSFVRASWTFSGRGRESTSGSGIGSSSSGNSLPVTAAFISSSSAGPSNTVSGARQQLVNGGNVTSNSLFGISGTLTSNNGNASTAGPGQQQAFVTSATADSQPLEVSIDTSKARSTGDVVRMCIRELGWKEYPNGRRDGEPCDLYWHSLSFSETGDLPSGKINKFPGMLEAVRKVNLGRALDQIRHLFPDEYNFHPRSWFLPQQYTEFLRAANSTTPLSDQNDLVIPGLSIAGGATAGRSAGTLRGLSSDVHYVQVVAPQRGTSVSAGGSRSTVDRKISTSAEPEARCKQVYIVKPDEGSQGEGIYIIQDAREYVLNEQKRHVIQEYVTQPLLIDSLKFDLRVYVVLTSLDPLEIYISRDGLARFCTVPYEHPTNRNIHSAFMHLTNYSLNKKSRNYLHTESEDDGSKRTIKSVLRQLKRMGFNVDEIWREIKTLVIKTIISISPELKVEYKAEIPSHRSGPTCFQILGFDILLRDDGRPILLEVNANPSLRIDYDRELAPGVSQYVNSPVDEEIKKPLVMDTLLLVAPRFKILSPRRQMSRLVGGGDDDPSSARSSTSRRGGGGGGSLSDQLALSSGSPGLNDAEDDELEPDDVEVFPKPPHKGYGSLDKIYPHRTTKDLDSLCLLNRAASIFLECLGFRETLKMSAAAFRTFVRKCRLTGSGSGLTNATMDILFIEMSRRWENSAGDRLPGLSLRGFIEVLYIVARRRYPSPSLLESVQQLIAHCDAAIDIDKRQTSSALTPLQTTSSTSSASNSNAIAGQQHLHQNHQLQQRLPLIGSSRSPAEVRLGQTTVASSLSSSSASEKLPLHYLQQQQHLSPPPAHHHHHHPGPAVNAWSLPSVNTVQPPSSPSSSIVTIDVSNVTSESSPTSLYELSPSSEDGRSSGGSSGVGLRAGAVVNGDNLSTSRSPTSSTLPRTRTAADGRQFVAASTLPVQARRVAVHAARTSLHRSISGPLPPSSPRLMDRPSKSQRPQLPTVDGGNPASIVTATDAETRTVSRSPAASVNVSGRPPGVSRQRRLVAPVVRLNAKVDDVNRPRDTKPNDE